MVSIILSGIVMVCAVSALSGAIWLIIDTTRDLMGRYD